MPRLFIKPELQLNSWTDLDSYINQLLNTELSSLSTFKTWLAQWDELSRFISEDLGWRYIRMTCNTADEHSKNRYLDFVQTIQPKWLEASDALNRKIHSCSYANQFKEPGFEILKKNIETELDLYRPNNISLQTELQDLEQSYGTRCGSQTIEHEGNTLTLQQASVFLKNPQREIREQMYFKIQDRRAQDEEFFNELLSQMIDKRHQMALNAGFNNYRDYKHRALNRLDYTVEDCFKFHQAIERVAVPIYRKKERLRRERLKLNTYRPWDTSVEVDGLSPLKPFENGADLLEKTIACFSEMDVYFADCLIKMKQLGRLDLESRVGKSPGGYQYPLYESKLPFIFMNAVGLHRDLVTMVHEGGHAIHSFLYQDLTQMAYQSPPSEMAELASMGMELMSMEHWHVFFKTPEELKRAKQQQLEGVIDTLPWIAAVDAFQHALYQEPHHTLEWRRNQWTNIMDRFGNTEVDYSGLFQDLARKWQAQLHIFEVPFYYIEYGIAQMGAIALWRNYKQNPKETLKKYKAALALGYTRSLPELYALAGIEFNFSAAYMNELMEFVWNEYQTL